MTPPAPPRPSEHADPEMLARGCVTAGRALRDGQRPVHAGAIARTVICALIDNGWTLTPPKATP